MSNNQDNENEELDQNDPILIANANLKLQLLNVIKQIDESISKRKEIKQLNKATRTELHEPYLIDDTINWLKKFESYKQEITALNNKLQSNYSYSLMVKKEDELKEKKRELNSLEKEYNSLKRIEKNQNKGLDEINNLHNVENELKLFSEKIGELKKEIHTMKVSNRENEEKIKLQNSEILKLADHCRLIKSNIEYAKENKNKGEDIGLNSTEEVLNKKNEEINDLTNELKQKELQLKIEKKNYMNSLTKQDENLLQLEEDIGILQQRLKHDEMEIYYDELKLDKLKKMKKNNEMSRGENERGNTGNFRYVKSEDASNRNKNKYSSLDNKKNFYINNKHIYGNMGMNMNVNSFGNNAVSNADKQKFINNIRGSKPLNKTPFIIKSFNNNNVNNNNNNYNNNVYKFNIKNDKREERPKNEVMKEIEGLKKDIEFALNEDNTNRNNNEKIEDIKNYDENNSNPSDRNTKKQTSKPFNKISNFQ